MTDPAAPSTAQDIPEWTFNLEHEQKHAQWAWDTNQESLAWCLDGFIAYVTTLQRELAEARAHARAADDERDIALRMIETGATVEELDAQARELEAVRTKLDLLREICRPGIEDAPDGPATFLRATRKILGLDALAQGKS